MFLPKTPLLLAFILTVILLVGVSVLYWLPDQGKETSPLEDLQLQECAGDILHLDEVLTMSACMAAATGDPKWEERYRQHEPKLDAAIQEAIKLSRSAFMSESAAKTFEANKALVKMENEAFEFVRRGQLEAATSLLYGDEYEEQKRIYSEGLESVSKAVRDRANRNLNARQREDRIVWASFLGALICAGSFWVSLIPDKSRGGMRFIAERDGSSG